MYRDNNRNPDAQGTYSSFLFFFGQKNECLETVILIPMPKGPIPQFFGWTKERMSRDSSRNPDAQGTYSSTFFVVQKNECPEIGQMNECLEAVIVIPMAKGPIPRFFWVVQKNECPKIGQMNECPEIGQMNECPKRQ